MASPSRDAIGTYMSITGSSESLAVQKLEEYGGDLTEAVNAHFNGGDIRMYCTCNLFWFFYYLVLVGVGGYGDLQLLYDCILLCRLRSFKLCVAFMLFWFSANPPTPAFPQHNIVQSNNENHFGRGIGPILSAARSFRPSLLLDPNYRRDMFSRFTAAGASLLSPSAASTNVPAQRPEQLYPVGPSPDSWDADHTPTGYSTSQLDNDVEDEMVQAAIRASIQEAEASAGDELSERQFYPEDADLAHALALSLKTAEQERAVRGQQMKDNYHQALEVDRRSKPRSSSNENEAQYFDEEQQLRRKSNRGAGNHRQHYEEASHSGEWGGRSSKELDEELTLEAASDSSLNAPQRQSGLRKSVIPEPQPIHRPASPPYSASGLLKEQQDKEYEMSLLMDKKKEEESCRKMLNELEFERTLAAKKASLPCEPALDDENAVTILVRMPDGNRAGRRFLKYDKLQLLFDFIDICGKVKPGTYRVVRSYPRRAFTVYESLSTLTELGLTNKQEALFLEMIPT